MKIRRIRLAAYGPFTDVTLDLTGNGSDFHLVYGPNEAGKSTALKALRHMLFGLPARTAVDFLHSYARLRVGATLVNGAGEEITFVRRKRRVKTLRDAADEIVLDDDVLAPFLGGVGAEMFEQMFAIGHDDLVRGGEEIVSGQGSVGEALFAAGAGLIPLQNVQQALEQQCGDLFKPSGSTPRINQTLKAVKEARRQQKEALLLPRTWKDHDQALRDARRRMTELKETLAAGKQRTARLERIRDALPLIARKKEIDADLIAYQGVPDLEPDFEDQRRDAEKELKIATRDLERALAALEKTGKAMDALPQHQALLENAAAIESLQHDLGSYRKAQKDRPALDGRMRTLQSQAAAMLAEIGADLPGRTGDDLTLPPATVEEIQELARTHQTLIARRESAADQQRKHDLRFKQLTEQRKDMPTPVDVTDLEPALQAAQEAGPIEKQLAEMRAEIAAQAEELDRALKRQTLWIGSPAQIEALPLPSAETIDRFEDRFDQSRRTLEKQQAAQAATEEEIADTRAQIQAIDRSREVPTETDLNDARGLRDQGWGLIRENLAGRTPPPDATEEILRHFEEAPDLPAAFETSMQRADHIADRLRREADQVSRKSLLEARKTKAAQTLADIAAALATTQQQQNELQTEWQNAWQPAGITPMTPKEMRSWRTGMLALRDKQAQWRTRQRQSESLAAQLTALKVDLLAALDTAGMPRDESKPLASLVRTAQRHIKTQHDLKTDIAAADKELRRLAAERQDGAAALAELDQTLSRWKTDWERSVQKLGIRADASPTAALAVIDSVREVRNKTGEADVLRKRIDGIDRDCAQFIARVDDLVATLAPDLEAESQDRAAERLNGKLTQARKDDAKRADLTERRDATRQELEDAQRRRFACEATLESLCKAANCDDPAALAATEQRARQRRTLIQERAGLEQQLRKLSAGATVDDFTAEAQAMDADRIDPELQELVEATRALETERSDLDQQIGALKATLDRMDGSAQAATHAEEAERLLAGLESDVEHYARLKIASIILARTVEQYREKHQGPLIARASDLFARMTLGAFSRLRADYDDKGNPVLVGIRAATDAQVTVDGMSDGTADQLYLALRLAGLEQYLENNEPLPFVVDDILLRFDDARALATLDVLGKLSTKTQVLFFTHHQHLVELLKNTNEIKSKFNFQQLGG